MSFLSLFIPTAWAHEVYVLSPQEVAIDKAAPAFDLWAPLRTASNLHTFMLVTIGVLVGIVLITWLRRTAAGQRLYTSLERFRSAGALVLRVALGCALLGSALSWSLFGPEISLFSFPVPLVLRTLLFVSGLGVLFGVFTQAAALIALGLWLMAAAKLGTYLLTYINYLGEILALLLFGAGRLSGDGWFKLPRLVARQLRRYEPLLIRLTFGIALLYAAIFVKFLHPALTLDVVIRYHLTSFHWLFPSDPYLVVLGAALAELALSLFIIFGWHTRIAVLITLFYITLSLLYFRESVWPHLMLYGPGIYLLCTPAQSRYTANDHTKRR